MSKLTLDQKKPERFTFGQKFYINEVTKLLNPKDDLMKKINDDKAYLTKADWTKIKEIYQNRKVLHKEK